MVDVYPWVARHVVARLHSYWEGNGYVDELSRLEESQWWTGDRIAAEQDERLTRLLEYARDHTPFYRDLLPSGALDNPREHLRKLPVVDKAAIQENPESFRSTGEGVPPSTVNATGGSTGEPLRFLVDENRWGTRKAATLRHNAWAGLRLGTPWIALWGQPRDLVSTGRFESLRLRLLDRMIPMDASALTPESLDSLARLLHRRPNLVIQAYGGALALFLEHLERSGQTGARARSIITSAELMPPGTREKARRLLGAPVFDRYGCREFSVVASECSEHAMHVNAENLLVEILDGDTPVRPGQAGEVVITDLLNRAQPFIRYRLGDLATPVEEPCPCGRGLPRMRLLAGRITDFIATPERGWVSGVSLATYLITHLDGVAQVRIEQDEADAVLLRVRPLEGKAVPETELRRRAMDYLGPGMEVRIEEDRTLAREGSGKFRFSVSRFSPVGVAVPDIDGGETP